jgi:ubiquinone/menaquinone biosynthesis C-methylase UbiE
MDDPLKKAKEKAAASYNAAADHFDDEPLSFWDLIGKRTVTNLKLQPGAKVLDVGCGTGASALPAAQVVGKDGFVVGVDLAARLLDRARSKAAASTLDNVEFRVADMTALNYALMRSLVFSRSSLFRTWKAWFESYGAWCGPAESSG